MRYFGKVRLGHKTVVEMSKQIVGAASSNNDKNAIKCPKSIETCIYVCRSFYVFSSWFNYNNLLISYSNGTWSTLNVPYLLSSTGRVSEIFMTFLFGATSRELANGEGIQTGSRTGRKTLDGSVASLLSHGVRQGHRAEILGATYVILHACLAYIFYVICMKMLLEGPPVKRRTSTHVL